MIWRSLYWLSEHWPLALLYTAVVVTGAYVISAAVYALWLASEEREEAAKRKRFEALMGLSDKAHGAPRAPGHPHRRIS